MIFVEEGEIFRNIHLGQIMNQISGPGFGITRSSDRDSSLAAVSVALVVKMEQLHDGEASLSPPLLQTVISSWETLRVTTATPSSTARTASAS